MEKVAVDVSESANMGAKLTDHLVGAVQLLHQLTCLKFLVGPLPAHESSHHCFQVIVAHQSDCKLLATHVMAQQSLPLYSQVINSVVHARKTGFCGSDKVFISNDFVNQLLFGQVLQAFLSIDVLVLPAVEESSTGMAHQVEDKLSFLLSVLASVNPVFPLIKSLGHNLEFTVLEEEANDSFLHVILLSSCLLVQIFFNLFGGVPTADQRISHGFSLSHLVVPEQDHVTLSVDGLSDTFAFGELLPLHEVVAEPVARSVLEDSGQEFMLVIFLECAELQLVESKGLPPVKHFLNDRDHGAGAVLSGFLLTLTGRDGVMGPVEEGSVLI